LPAAFYGAVGRNTGILHFVQDDDQIMTSKWGVADDSVEESVVRPSTDDDRKSRRQKKSTKLHEVASLSEKDLQTMQEFPIWQLCASLS
jgi:hypothetical protein